MPDLIACHRSPALAEAAFSGDWPEGLRRHMEGCRPCQENLARFQEVGPGHSADCLHTRAFMKEMLTGQTRPGVTRLINAGCIHVLTCPPCWRVMERVNYWLGRPLHQMGEHPAALRNAGTEDGPDESGLHDPFDYWYLEHEEAVRGLLRTRWEANRRVPRSFAPAPHHSSPRWSSRAGDHAGHPAHQRSRFPL